MLHLDRFNMAQIPVFGEVEANSFSLLAYFEHRLADHCNASGVPYKGRLLCFFAMPDKFRELLAILNW